MRSVLYSVCLLALGPVTSFQQAQASDLAGDVFATGAGAGGGPHVRAFDPYTGDEVTGFFAYDSRFGGGARVAVGDVNGDGYADVVTGAGPGGGPHVRVFSGVDNTEILGFFAYGATYTGGVHVAAGDVDGDGYADVVTAPGKQHIPRVQVYSGRDGGMILEFLAYPSSFRAGLTVGTSDVDGDGLAEIVTGAGTGGQVKIFSGYDGELIRSFYAFDRNLRSEIYVAGGDVDGDGYADIVTGAGEGHAPEVRVYSGRTWRSLFGFYAYDRGFGGGVRVGVADLDGDGTGEILTGAGPGGGPHVKAFDRYRREVRSFFAYAAAFTGGVYVAGSGTPYVWSRRD